VDVDVDVELKKRRRVRKAKKKAIIVRRLGLRPLLLQKKKSKPT